MIPHNRDYVPSALNVDDVFDESDDANMQYLDDQDKEINHRDDDSADVNDGSVYEDENSDDPATSDIDDQTDDQIDGKIDETTGFRVGWYTKFPKSLRKAKIQGAALLRVLFVDFNGEIAKNIAKVKGFSNRHTNNNKCKRVQKYLFGLADLADDTVPFIIAIWCMLGGNIPNIWKETRRVQSGVKRPLTERGKRMVDELQHLGKGDGFEFKLCKPYATGGVATQPYNYTEAVKAFEKLPNASTYRGRKAKHVGSSASGNLRPTKRRKLTAVRGQPEPRINLSAAKEAQHEDLDHQLDNVVQNQAHHDGLFAEPSKEALMAEINGLKFQNANQAKTITYLSNAMETLREEKAAMEEPALTMEVNSLKLQTTDQFTTIRDLGNSLEAAQQEKTAAEEKGAEALKLADAYTVRVLETNRELREELRAQLKGSRRQTETPSS